MRIFDFIEESIVDGEGLRAVIAIQGCNHNCIGCHNINSHSFEGGMEFDEYMQNTILSKLSNNILLDGLTLSGGDPFYSAKDLIPFIQLVKQNLPHLNIWAYTGFEFEELIQNQNKMFELLNLCDIIVDGSFVLNQKDLTLPFRGSRNQRIIDVKESLKQNKIILYL